VGHTENEPNPDGKPIRGFNAYAVRTADAPWFDAGLRITKSRDTYFLAVVQGNWSMTQRDPFSGKELDRKPARRATVEEYKHNPEFAKMPPSSPGETPLIDENTPGSRSVLSPHGPGGHDHDHDHDKNGHDHD